MDEMNQRRDKCAQQRDEARAEVEQLTQALHDARLENSGQAALLERTRQMSGGSLNYGYERIETLAEEIERRAECALHKAFARHLFRVAQAAHDLEWVWSGDWSPGDEEAAIKACMDWRTEMRTVIQEQIEWMRVELNELENSATQKEAPHA
jgi:hypothetical protein